MGVAPRPPRQGLILCGATAHGRRRSGRYWARANRPSQTIAGTATPIHSLRGQRWQDSPPSAMGTRPISGWRRLTYAVPRWGLRTIV